MIDSSGYRLNVGIILTNHKGQLFWARRVGQNAWQFPQGGVHENESLEEALYRELHEEAGLKAEDVNVLATSKGLLSYRLPKKLIRQDNKPICVGQKQKWFLLRHISSEDNIRFDQGDKPEFDDWMWVNYWFPLRQVIAFKREVYRRALKEFLPTLFPQVTRRPKLDPIDFWEKNYNG